MHDRAANEIAPPVSRFNDEVGSDIDAIVAKSLAKLPEERYASVESLANDIRNYLAGQPVNAKAPSAYYRARKFIGRHRLGASFALFAVLALSGITVQAVYSAKKSEKQSEVIALERDRAEEIRDFLVSIFGSADPNRFSGDLTAREILDTGRERIAAIGGSAGVAG